MLIVLKYLCIFAANFKKNINMKYKIGDKVKYDGGDWWFYGTVSAVFEHSICPCYRLNVERMEKKSCKFSITQFEYELEAYNESVERGKDKRKWEDTEVELLKKHYGVLDVDDLSKMLKRSQQSILDKILQVKSEPQQAPEQKPDSEPEKKTRRRKPKQETKTGKVEDTQKLKNDTQKPKISDAWFKNLESYQKGEKNSSIYNWVSINRKLHKSGELPSDKLEKLTEINFPFDADRKKAEKGELTQKPKKKEQKKETPKRKRGEGWDMNYELYRNGEKSNAISTWIALNRKEFKTGKLAERKLDKLMEINFPFETTKKKKQVAGTSD